jgi:arylsulfatase
MRTIISALATAWVLSGVFRAAAALAIDRHWAHGLHALALDGLADAVLAPSFLAAAALATIAATLVGLIATRIQSSQVLAGVGAAGAYFAALGWYELNARTVVWDVMTQQLKFTSIHAGIVAVVGLAFVVTAVIVVGRGEGSPARPLATMAVLALAALVSRGASTALTAAPEDAPNIILITVDTLRADHMGAYGYSRPTSPRLDALAAEGVLYERSISQAPNTHPSMASMLTSQYPSRLGGKALKYIHYALPTIAEVLGNAGYDTAAIVSNVWLKEQMGFNEGFAHFDQTSGMSEFYAEQERFDWKDASHISNAALAWLDDAPKSPFFLWLHYLDPHHPYDPPAPYNTKFKTAPRDHDDFLAKLREMRTREQTRLLVKMGTGQESVTDAEFQSIVDQYDGEIAFNDMQIGKVLDRVTAMGIDENTMVIVTSDHGEEFRDHAGWGHSHTLHRELLHVPLIIRYPRGTQAPAPGSRVHHRVRTLDIAPTIAAAAGQALPDSMEGRDLRNLNGADRIAISQLSRKHWTSIAMDNWKLITRPGAEADTDAVSFYDLETDLYEHHNIAAEHPDEVKALASTLNEHVGARAAGETISETAEQLDPETRRALEALGYID